MIHVGLSDIIRRLRLRHGLEIREIARRTGLSRNTVKKHLEGIRDGIVSLARNSVTTLVALPKRVDRSAQ